MDKTDTTSAPTTDQSITGRMRGLLTYLIEHEENKVRETQLTLVSGMPVVGHLKKGPVEGTFYVRGEAAQQDPSGAVRKFPIEMYFTAEAVMTILFKDDGPRLSLAGPDLPDALKRGRVI